MTDRGLSGVQFAVITVRGRADSTTTSAGSATCDLFPCAEMGWSWNPMFYPSRHVVHVTVNESAACPATTRGQHAYFYTRYVTRDAPCIKGIPPQTNIPGISNSCESIPRSACLLIAPGHSKSPPISPPHPSVRPRVRPTSVCLSITIISPVPARSVRVGLVCQCPPHVSVFVTVPEQPGATLKAVTNVTASRHVARPCDGHHLPAAASHSGPFPGTL